MFPSNMVERLWYVFLCFIGNSHLFLPSFGFSLRDGSAVHARVIGSNGNGSTVHIMLQRSTTAQHGCEPGFYQHDDRPGPATLPSRVRRRATSIVGRSGQRTSGTQTEETLLDQPFIGLCLKCTECSVGEFQVQECNATRNTVCQSCDGHEPCVPYKQILASGPSKKGNSGVNKVNPDLTASDVNKQYSLGQEPDININIQEAGRDERNSWYFLSLCALIGLLVFLSLVMGAYLVSVKVTSWWRYQRPITVRRRGTSFHEDNQINMSAMVPPHPLMYDEYIASERARDANLQKPRETAMGEPKGRVLVGNEDFPSTSKIHVVQLKSDGLGFESMLAFNSYEMSDDGGGFAKQRYANQFHPRGPGWRCPPPPRDYNDSSDYSFDDDDEEEDIYVRGNPNSAMYYGAQASPVLQKSSRKYLYHSLPLNATVDHFQSDGEMHIVQWPFSFAPVQNSGVSVSESGAHGKNFCRTSLPPQHSRVKAEIVQNSAGSVGEGCTHGSAFCSATLPQHAKVKVEHPLCDESSSSWFGDCTESASQSPSPGTGGAKRKKMMPRSADSGRQFTGQRESGTESADSAMINSGDGYGAARHNRNQNQSYPNMDHHQSLHWTDPQILGVYRGDRDPFYSASAPAPYVFCGDKFDHQPVSDTSIQKNQDFVRDTVNDRSEKEDKMEGGTTTTTKIESVDRNSLKSSCRDRVANGLSHADCSSIHHEKVHVAKSIERFD